MGMLAVIQFASSMKKLNKINTYLLLSDCGLLGHDTTTLKVKATCSSYKTSPCHNREDYNLHT
jgi:hypothetical protein